MAKRKYSSCVTRTNSFFIYDKVLVFKSCSFRFLSSLIFNYYQRENIRLGKINASDTEIEDASKKANAHDFIMNLPKKYDTLVGEK